jgi:cysteinyl-tRNA synthetase
MRIRFYNTLTRKKEVFKPLHGKRVNMFVCGPTVYDSSHIGHARTYLAFDIFVRYLRAIGYAVFFLENITDISERITDRARQTGDSPRALAKRFEKEFLQDMKALGIRSVTRYARATDFIPEIIKQVERLIRRGFAYEVNGSVYYRIRKFKDYGKLSGQNIRKLQLQAKKLKSRDVREAFGEETEKENPLDFALWKASHANSARSSKASRNANAPVRIPFRMINGEPAWLSPWGWGRPGWHIEDTAISETFFGAQYDIHGGGLELIFPHHECEIAQQEAASGKSPFVRYWLHTGHLKVRGEKMSKSLGNFITIADLLKNVEPEVFRFLIALNHYRKPLNYTPELLSQASASRERILEFTAKLRYAQFSLKKVYKLGTGRVIAKARQSFYAALANDFATPEALAIVFGLIKKVNPLLDGGKLNRKDAKDLAAFFKEVDTIFGFIGKRKTDNVPAAVRALVGKREKLRKQRRWEEADKLRKQIESRGWIIEDTPSGSRLKKIPSTKLQITNKPLKISNYSNF